MDDSSPDQYFADLYELSVDRSLSLTEKIARALSLGWDRLDVDYGVLSYTGDGEYEIVGSTFTEGAYVAESVHDLSTTWCRHVVDRDEVLAISNAPDSTYSDDIALESTGLQCYIGAPVHVDGRLFGTLCFSGEEPREEVFDDNAKRFVRLLAKWVGYELERENHYAAIDRQNERLDEFAGVLAHDIRNPLTTARGYTELVHESATGQEAEFLDTALDALDRIDTLITDTLALARKGEDVGRQETVELGAVAQQAWRTVQPENATLTVEDDRSLTADRSRLEQLFENLFRNVDDHCGDGTSVTVRGTSEGFIVEDDGPGIPEAIADSLFGGNYGDGRPGLGLLIIERVVSGHGWTGDLDVSDGTRFEFSGVDATSRDLPDRLEMDPTA